MTRTQAHFEADRRNRIAGVHPSVRKFWPALCPARGDYVVMGADNGDVGSVIATDFVNGKGVLPF